MHLLVSNLFSVYGTRILINCSNPDFVDISSVRMNRVLMEEISSFVLLTHCHQWLFLLDAVAEIYMYDLLV